MLKRGEKLVTKHTLKITSLLSQQLKTTTEGNTKMRNHKVTKRHTFWREAVGAPVRQARLNRRIIHCVRQLRQRKKSDAEMTKWKNVDYKAVDLKRVIAPIIATHHHDENVMWENKTVSLSKG